MEYNKDHGITPKTVVKPFREKIIEGDEVDATSQFINEERSTKEITNLKTDNLTAYDKQKLIKKLEREMKRYASDLNFESAIALRDKLRELKGAK